MGKAVDKTNLENSVKALARQVGCTIATNDKLEGMVANLTNKLKGQTETRAKEMRTVSKMMDLQVDIDELLKNKSEQHEKDEKIGAIQQKYNKLLADSINQNMPTGIFHKQTRGITWVKNGDHKPIKGGLQSYIMQRAAELDKEHSYTKDKTKDKEQFKKTAKEINKSKSISPDLAKQSFFFEVI